jgi:uncharacterized membrane protein
VPVSPISGGAGATENGVPFLVSAGIVYEIIAAACSSPQTAEINADKRAGTLMKWVHVGLVQSVLFIAIAAYVDRRHAPAIIAGGGLAGGIMYGSYLHAKKAGLASSEPGTEGQDDSPWMVPKGS